MTEVEYPAMRAEVLGALASLSDPEYQHRVWERKEYPRPGFYDDLSQNIHILYDDTDVLPNPESMLGTVLLPGDEVQRLRTLDRALGPLIDELGSVPDNVYLLDERWPAVIRAAADALSAMINDGLGFWPTDKGS